MLLSVWILLQPPVRDGQVLVGAPLGDWVVNGKFPTRKQCTDTRASSEAALFAGVTQAKRLTSPNTLSDRERMRVLAGPAGALILDSRCVELDDLKRRLGRMPASEAAGVPVE